MYLFYQAAVPCYDGAAVRTPSSHRAAILPAVQELAEPTVRPRRSMRRFVVVLAIACLSASACTGDAGDDAAAPDDAASPVQPASPAASGSFVPTVSAAASPTPSPTPPVVPGRRPRRGAPSTTCVDGWVTPPAGSALFTDPLGIIRRTAPVDGDFEVVDMRMFTGPESPPSGRQGLHRRHPTLVHQALRADDLSYQGRFLVEQRVFGRGVAAVAPYDTEGFSSPDWSGFQYDSAERLASRIRGCPAGGRASPTTS